MIARQPVSNAITNWLDLGLSLGGSSSLKTSPLESTLRRARSTSHRRPLSVCSEWYGSDSVPFAPLRPWFTSMNPSPEGIGIR